MLPSGVEAALDGLPWQKPAEALIVAAALPLLLLLDRKWLSFKPALLLIAVILFAKVILALLAPQSGWCLRVYAGPHEAQKGQIARTWERLWCKGCSAILSKPMADPRELPAEWLNRLDEPQRSQAAPIIQLTGYAAVPQGWGLAVAAKGIRGGLLQARDEKGRLWEMPLLKRQIQSIKPGTGNMPGGRLKIDGRLAYGPIKGEPWSLAPLLVGPNSRVVPARGKGVLWRDKTGVEMSLVWLKVLRGLARAVDWGLGLWFVGWLVWALAGLYRKVVLSPSVATAAITGLIVWWLLPRMGHDPLFVPHGAAFAALGVLTVLSFRKQAAESPSPGLAVLLSIGPLLLLHFGQQWAAEAGRFSIYSMGDDWLTYQRHASDIVMGQDYLMAKRQPILYEQPLYRYVTALFHFFFGQSTMAQNFLDVWSAIGGAGLVAALAVRLGAPTAWAFMAAWLYVNFELGDRFLLHIGRGLQEHSAMLLMLLAAWAALRARAQRGLAWAAMAGLFAMAGFWLRMDHLGVLAGLGLLMVPEVAGGWTAAWRNLIAGAWQRRKRILIYWGLLIAGVLAIIIRNGLIGGQWVLVHPDNASFLDRSLLENFKALLDVLDGSDRGALISARVMWPGAILGLLALVLRFGPLKEYPLSLGISLAGLLTPYLVVQASAYFPRWSIHLLPLACLSMALFLNSLAAVVPHERTDRLGSNNGRDGTSLAFE